MVDIYAAFTNYQPKINFLEQKSNNFQNLTFLKNELTHVNESAQNEDAHIQSFLCAFLPEFKLSAPAVPPSNCTSLSPEPPPLEEIKMPQVQIQFKMENSIQ